jgi:hypothetical protein
VRANERGKKSSSRKRLVVSRRVVVPIKPSIAKEKIRTLLASCRVLSGRPGKKTSDFSGAVSICRGVIH